MNIKEILPDREIKYSLALITSEVLNDLQMRGFSYLFKLNGECICCKDYSIGFDEFDILEVHSMETSFSSGENHVLYAVKCDKFNIKGIIINSFNAYANEFSNICISKILDHEQLRFEYYKAGQVSK